MISPAFIPSSIRHLSDEDFNTQLFLTLFSKTKRALTINCDLIQKIFSFLPPSGLCTANLINKTCYVVYHTPHLKAFEWIFFSSVIRQKELRHPFPLIQYGDGSSSLPPALSTVGPHVLIMDRYVKHNYWKQLIELLSSGKELTYADILDQFRLAADQGHEPAIKHFIDLYLQNCLEYEEVDEKNHNEFLDVIHRYADRGSESAITFLVGYFIENTENGDSSTQENRLKLIKKYANRGSEAAIKGVLDVFCKEAFGINANDEKTQKTCLNMAQNYVEKFQSEAAIEFILKAYKESLLGFNWKDYQVQNQCMQFAKKYAALKSETAIAFTLDMQAERFKLLQTKEAQQEALLLADYYARKFRSEEAINFLLQAHNSNRLGLASSVERRKKRDALAQEYADAGSEAAIKFILRSKSIVKRYENAKKYAALKSEKAIKYMLKATCNRVFLLSSDEPISHRWKLAIKYLKQGSLAALKMMIHAYQIEFD